VTKFVRRKIMPKTKISNLAL